MQVGQKSVRAEQQAVITPMLGWLAILIFIVQIILFFWKGVDLNNILGISSKESGLFHILTLFSTLLIHQEIFQIIGNVPFIFLFGENIEDNLGKANFFLFYIFCAIAANIICLVAFSNYSFYLIGPGAAVSSLVGAFYYLFPDVKLTVSLGFFSKIFGEDAAIRLPVSMYMVIWLGYQIFYAIFVGEYIPIIANIIGFIVGNITIRLLMASKPIRGIVTND